MLDIETRRRIDAARDILVGKVPDPKSQVEQITIALIYKFMDDMDARSEELGGQRTFFAGEFAQYGWPRLARSGLGGYAMLNLYAEAIARMPENPQIPQLFRSIFNNAYLPYRDPETLRSFLRIIDEFNYDHSERLGDAYEYLLSVLGAQGDAGQFRTPRHIIDFIVAVIDPQPSEAILDPACGTAGFLISAYQHIRRANTDPNGSDLLTPDAHQQLARNLKGYDISPDMVRLSQANMYLHGFANPQIYEYDTLTSEERWNDFADVIMANPPFMSPKGGIRPHNRFAVPSRRSEVLFVDYIAEHLNPGGRAGVIVPEGVIFQSQRGHTRLRRLLAADYLAAVVSLPAGVFKPYSGVKTSILILDHTLAKRADGIAFFKAAHDGYDLGDQRRPIADNDLPAVQAELTEYLRRVREGVSLDDFEPTLGLVVSKERIAADGEYGLRGERYQQDKPTATQWPLVELNKVATIESGSRQKGGAVSAGIPSIGGEQIAPDGSIRFDKMKFVSEAHFSGMRKGVLQNGDVLLVKDGATTGKCGYFAYDMPAAVNEHVFIVRARDNILPYYLYSIISSDGFQEILRPYIKGIIGGISREIGNITIPLPPLDIQQELAAEIEGYQRVIDGCRAVMDNWRPRIEVDPEWEMVEIGQILVDKPKYGSTASKSTFDGNVRYVRITDITDGGHLKINDPVSPSQIDKQYFLEQDDLLIARSGSVGRAYLHQKQAIPHQYGGYLIRFRIDHTKALPKYIYYITKTDIWAYLIAHNSKVGTINNINARQYSAFRLPLPPLPVQQAIVAEIEAEGAAVAGARALAERMGERIAAAVGRVWGAG